MIHSTIQDPMRLASCKPPLHSKSQVFFFVSLVPETKSECLFLRERDKDKCKQDNFPQKQSNRMSSEYSHTKEEQKHNWTTVCTHLPLTKCWTFLWCWRHFIPLSLFKIRYMCKGLLFWLISLHNLAFICTPSSQQQLPHSTDCICKIIYTCILLFERYPSLLNYLRFLVL